MDADQLGMMGVYASGVDMSENGQAMSALRTNPHGQHFLGNSHTLQNFEHAFYRSTIADNNSFEQWRDEGSPDAAQRANSIWKQMLKDYEAPKIDDAIDEEMLEYIAVRKDSEPDEIG
jgi:trimethylamine--corrinoid protein Co-methyltransferase